MAQTQISRSQSTVTGSRFKPLTRDADSLEDWEHVLGVTWDYRRLAPRRSPLRHRDGDLGEAAINNGEVYCLGFTSGSRNL